MPDKGARRCECRRVSIVGSRLLKVPPRFAGVTLDGLAARRDLHPGQAAAIELLRANPAESFVLCGRPGTGKTHLFWALYERAAQRLDSRVTACPMLTLINQYREAFRPRAEGEDPVRAEVMPNDLAQSGTPYSLFLDDIDKPRMTEYVAEQIHALFDAAYNNRHQIVVTTNLSADELVAHFERADERYGLATVRRIVHDGNNLVEFF